MAVGDALLTWGAAVLEGLIGAGIDPAAIAEAGSVAIDHAVGVLPSARGVEAARGNSAAPAARG
jgi:hypothetical protein